MFYETERIVNKQQKYIKQKALNILNSFSDKKLSKEEIIACLDIMLNQDNTETKTDILNMARVIVLSKQEKNDDEKVTSTGVQLSFIDRMS